MNPKRTHLEWFDFVILTLIFFGMAIYTSTTGFLELSQADMTAPSELVFDSDTNYYAIIQELITLAVAFLYLNWRRFDFGQFVFKLTRLVPLKIVLYILIAGTVATVSEYVLMALMPEWYPDLATQSLDTQSLTSQNTQIPDTQSYNAHEHLSQLSPSLVLFALLNGFFEELYFLGIVFATAKKYPLVPLFLLSLLVRFSFHTYQGLAGALVISTLGVVFFALRKFALDKKDDNLLPFVLAHAFFDIFGLGLPLYWLAG